GLAQRWGGPIEQIRPGDVIWIPPGEKHWHGATATTAVTHVAIQEHLKGEVVDWMEKVTDDQYGSVEGNNAEAQARKKQPGSPGAGARLACDTRIRILCSGLMGAKLGTTWARARHGVVFSDARSAQQPKRLAA